MGKFLAPMYKVTYRTADQVSRVSNELAGSFMYFATGQDAMDTGLFCQKVLIPVWPGDREEKEDFLGKPFAFLLRDRMSQDELSLAA